MNQQGNSYDYWIFRVCNAMLETGGVFYDVGANVGYITIEVARLRQPDEVRVVAIEPHCQLVRNLVKTVQINELSNVTVLDAAAGDTGGYVEYRPAANNFVGTVVDKASRRSYRVRSIRLDDLGMNHHPYPPDVIKIDVEGYELEVLTGSRRILAEHQPTLVFEVSAGTIRNNCTPAVLMNLISDAGEYRFFTVKGEPLNCGDVATLPGQHTDILAVSPIHGARFDWYMRELTAGRIDQLW